MPWQGFDRPDAPGPAAAPAGFADRFGADFGAGVFSQLGRTSSVIAETAAYDEAIDRVYAVTGRKVPNPALIADGLAKQESRTALEQAWGQARQQDSTLGDFPDIDARAVQMAKDRVRAAQDAAAASVGAGGVGGFLGSTAASMLHPAQLATLPFGAAGGGATWGARILREAAVNGALGVVTQIPIELEAAAWRDRVGVKQSSLENIVGAGVGGAVLGGGFKAIGEGFSALRGARPAPTPHTPRWLADRFESSGWSPNAAAGLAANAAHESGGANASGILNFGAVGDGGNSHGVFQWNGPRKEALMTFASERGQNWHDPETQLSFFNAELAQFPGLRERMNAAKSPEEAAQIFVREFERPADMETNLRVRAETAKEIADSPTGNVQPRDAEPLDMRDARRAVERAALDMDHAHGPDAAQRVHGENMRAVERAIADGEIPELAPLLPPIDRVAIDTRLKETDVTYAGLTAAGRRQRIDREIDRIKAGGVVIAPSGRKVNVQRETVERSALVQDPNAAPHDGPPIVDRHGVVEAGMVTPEAPRDGYADPVTIDRRVQHMTDAERELWRAEMDAKPKPDALADSMGDAAPDFQAAQAIMRNTKDVAAEIADGAPIPAGVMNMLRLMHDDPAMKVRSSPETVAARVREFAAEAKRPIVPDASPARSMDSGPTASPPDVARLVERVQAVTETAVQPEAVDAISQEARRTIADALIERPGFGDQKIELDDGRIVDMADVDAELRRLERVEEGADIIHTACILGKPIAGAAT